MAIFHLSITPISRRDGRTAVAAAAYRSGTLIVDDRSGEVHDYTRRRGVEHSLLVLPPNAPSWASDRATLWNSADQAERRSNARVARDVTIALPAELAESDRAELAARYARRLVDRYGLAVDLAIHHPDRKGDQRNHHVHLLLTTRSLSPEGFGPKIRVLDDRDHGPGEVEWMRSAWASECNSALERAKIAERIDHRSYKRQGLELKPTIHLGPAHTALARRGISSRKIRRNRLIARFNAALAKRKAQIAALKQELDELLRRAVRAVAPRDEADFEAFKIKLAAQQQKDLEELLAERAAKRRPSPPAEPPRVAPAPARIKTEPRQLRPDPVKPAAAPRDPVKDETDPDIKAFILTAKNRAALAPEYRDGGLAWEPLDEDFRNLVSIYNSKDQADREAVIEGIRKRPQLLDLIRENIAEQTYALSLAMLNGRGMSR